jgi:hypothetical protein
MVLIPKLYTAFAGFATLSRKIETIYTRLRAQRMQRVQRAQIAPIEFMLVTTQRGGLIAQRFSHWADSMVSSFACASPENPIDNI